MDEPEHADYDAEIRPNCKLVIKAAYLKFMTDKTSPPLPLPRG